MTVCHHQHFSALPVAVAWLTLNETKRAAESMTSLVRYAIPLPRYRTATASVPLRNLRGQPVVPGYVCHRTIFRSRAVLPAELNPRVGTIFLGLIGLGLISTMIGVYEFYASFAIWPEEVRADLRAGVKAKQQGNLALSHKLLTRALNTALSLPPDRFSPSPYLKLSGIAITLCEVLEQDNKPKEAYERYIAALGHLRKNWSALTSEEKLRAISLGQKLGEMADTYQLGEAEEERWLTWSVEEVLKLAKTIGNVEPGKSSEENHLVLSDLELPKWVNVTDIGAPLETLGAFYARTGKLTFAVPLYLHTISLLVPPVTSPRKATAEQLCRAAQLMSNLSELFMRSTPTPTALHQSESWARQALSLLQKTQANAGLSDDVRVCEDALAVILFNLGSLREMNGDPEFARQLFEQSLGQAKKLRFQEGITQARSAIRRLDIKQSQPPLPQPDNKIEPGSV
ncbi:hypothetical protein F5148DRAFT_1203714 [Russula earlei]|uniref:Uncharacterized protein n=1 Tax=Russula earlei TaxID=71964 RepID=A0ACC0U7B0_9AGAM|nr:hypothetical protein F5148DRAFT_1203714 [Russula earlei]